MLKNKNEQVIRVFRNDPGAYAALVRTLHAPSLYNAVIARLAARGLDVDRFVLERDVSQPYESGASLHAAWLHVYRHADQHHVLYEFGKKLVDIEVTFPLWRFRHPSTLRQIIGEKMGAGGGSGVGLLEKVLEISFFPELISIRTEFQAFSLGRQCTAYVGRTRLDKHVPAGDRLAAMASPADKTMTLEAMETLADDGRRYELARGRLIAEPPPGFRHGRVVARIVGALIEYADRENNGLVITADSGFVLARHPDTLRAPDVAFVRRERCEALADEPRAFPGPPDLAVEVLSPFDRERAVFDKIGDYLDAGTRVVWLVDPERREVRVFDAGGRILLGVADRLECPDVLPDFAIPVSALFRTFWSY